MELFRAVEDNDLVAATNTLNRGQSPNVKNAAGYTPLMIAAGRGNYQMCDLLLSAAADVHLLDNRMGASALHKAAQGGVVPVAKLLLKHGAFIDLQAPTHGHTPLIDASWHRNPAMVEFLLEEGANWEIEASDGLTARMWAEAAEDEEIVQLFVRHAERKNEYVASQRIFTAIEKNDVAAVKALLAEGLDVDQKAQYRVSSAVPRDITPLLLASREGRVEIVRLLLDAGANPRIVDWLMKSTVVHKSGYMGRADVIPLVLAKGAERDAQGPYNGYTALHDATWHGHTAAVRELLDAGARRDLEGHDGNTPLDLAKRYGYREIVELLRVTPNEASKSKM